MLKKIIAAVTLIALTTVVIVQAMEKAGPLESNRGLEEGVKAPDFELTTLDGKTVSLSDFEGKKVILNFWATWCPPCKEEMPDMQEFYSEYGNEVNILAVNIDPEYDVESFVKEMGIEFPILLDEKDKVSKMYKVVTLPTTFFLDEKGIITKRYLGAMSIDMMKEYTQGS